MRKRKHSKYGIKLRDDFQISEPDESISYYPPKIVDDVQEKSYEELFIKFLKTKKRFERVDEILSYGAAALFSGLTGMYVAKMYDILNAQSANTLEFSLSLIGMGATGIIALTLIRDGNKIGKKADGITKKISELEKKLELNNHEKKL